MGAPLPSSIQREVGVQYSSVLEEGVFKAVKPENLHFTLRFLGDTQASAIPALLAGLRSVHEERFTVTLSKPGHFNFQVLWLSVTQGRESMMLLKRGIDLALGLTLESFTPHLTLARNKNASPASFRNALRALEARAKDFTFTVEAFCLYSSKLEWGGARYEVEASFPLD